LTCGSRLAHRDDAVQFDQLRHTKEALSYVSGKRLELPLHAPIQDL
jgi:hypothetical protein